MNLESVLTGIEYELLWGNLNQKIDYISYDSRKVKPNSLFVCIKGFNTDGHKYIQAAIDKGAVAILVQDEVTEIPDVTILRTIDTRQALAKVASNYYKKPTQALRLVGVTGTNGKTTITHIIKAILEEEGKKTGMIGTLYAKIGDQAKKVQHTTPEAPELEEFMHLAVEKETDYVVMEVSSHALDLYRVNELDFNVAIFSNLSQDHLDFHHNMDEYKKAKLKLFKMIKAQENNYTIVNVDDDHGKNFIAETNCNTITYGLMQEADVSAIDLDISLKGTNFTVKYKNHEFKVKMKLIGLFSVYNVLAAIAFALSEKIEPSIITKALTNIEGIPGRFEQVDLGQDFTVIVDYAHTPDGLENILKTSKQIAENRLITVFGCGGDRDKSKRPLMGKIAAEYSNFCVVTSDNPRSEDPQAIIDDIVPGLNMVKDSRYAIILDRKDAINHAFHLAKKGDVIIIAGKGHETYQLVGEKVLEFDDREIAKETLRGLL